MLSLHHGQAGHALHAKITEGVIDDLIDAKVVATSSLIKIKRVPHKSFRSNCRCSWRILLVTVSAVLLTPTRVFPAALPFAAIFSGTGSWSDQILSLAALLLWSDQKRYNKGPGGEALPPSSRLGEVNQGGKKLKAFLIKPFLPPNAPLPTPFPRFQQGKQVEQRCKAKTNKSD